MYEYAFCRNWSAIQKFGIRFKNIMCTEEKYNCTLCLGREPILRWNHCYSAALFWRGWGNRRWPTTGTKLTLVGFGVGAYNLKTHFYRHQFQNVSMTKYSTIWVWPAVWTTSYLTFQQNQCECKKIQLGKIKQLWRERKFRSYFLQPLSKMKFLL